MANTLKNKSLKRKAMLEKTERKSRSSLKTKILQLWNTETEEIEYYKGKHLIRSVFILAAALLLT
jgi:hypothetical protein